MANTMEDLSLSPELLRQINEQISDIDSQLEVASGEAPGKTKLRNSWAKGEEVEIDGEKVGRVEKFLDGVLSKIDESIANEAPEFRAGVYFGLTKVLGSKDNKWKTEAEALLDASIPETEGEKQAVDIEQLRALRVNRNELVEQFVAIKNILDIMRPDIKDTLAEIPVPEKKKGALPGTVKGPRKLSQMVFSVDGTQVSPEKNSMAGLAEVVGGYDGARPFRKALDEQLKALPVEEGAKAKSAADPGDSFSVEINGHTVSGVKMASADEEVDDEDDEVEVE